VEMIAKGSHLLILAVVSMLLTGCAEDPQDEVANAGQARPVPTTRAPMRQASAEEQARFEEMLAAAMEDEEFSGADLTTFALESVRCTERAGFDASLGAIDPQNRTSTFSVTALSEFDETAELAMDACQTKFFLPALDLYDQTNPVDPEQARLDQARQDHAVLSCLAEAGFDFDDAFEGLSSDLVPDRVSFDCVIASLKRP